MRLILKNFKYVEQVMKMNLDEYLSMYQIGYDAWKNK
ncbi:hypothetical protein J2Z66_005635 [Paenibacillus eucommiae]|uniref:Uncharacterized protein n=1 Tax=Paenibacillus eucommiae TaxID=1355755 RepID=A0ABS4J2E8_9BACL|nr:hypothetical protein [Paenibacillus eucommiae]